MEKIKIGDVCEILNGYAFKSDNYVASGIRIIRIANVQKGYIEDNTPAFYALNSDGLDRYMLKKGDLLMSLTGNVGRVAILEEEFLPAALNQRVACLRLKTNKISKKYLFYILNSNYFEQQCILSSKGIAQKNMSTEWLKEYEIPLVSRNRQDRITNILDKCIDIISCRKCELEKLNYLIKARFVEMFGDTVDNPFGWEKHKLNEYIDFLTSGSRGWAKYFVDDENELFITIKNVKNNHIELNDVQYIVAPDNKEAERTKVKAGDLLISITADLGRTGVVDDEIAKKGAYINQHLSLIRLKQESVNPLYVSYFLETVGGKRQFERKNQNGVKAGLNFEAIKSLEILVPPKYLQEKFLNFVAQVDKSRFAEMLTMFPQGNINMLLKNLAMLRRSDQIIEFLLQTLAEVIEYIK